MKKALLLFGLILSFLITTKTYAVYDFVPSSPTPTSITTTMSVPVGTTSTFELLLSKESLPQTYTKKPVGETNPFGGSLEQKADAKGVVTWNITSGIQPTTRYFMRIVEKPSVTGATVAKPPFYTTEEKAFTTKGLEIFPDELVFDYNGTAGTVFVKGKFDITKNPYFRTYKTEIQYTKEARFNVSDPFYKVYKTHDSTNTQEGIADDGTYHLQLSNISPSVQYTIKQSVTAGSQPPTDQNGGITIGTFKSDIGYIASTNVAATQSDFEDRSYRLLAPFPGFTLFLDPDLCAEQAAAGNTGQLCDINDILNLAFKILIGAAAVLLVLRIMFEGYKYITTDIPGLKTSAKSHITEAVLGLLLALSSFLILNTINPKIVENNIDAGRLEIGVTLNDGLGLFGEGSASSDSDTNWAKTKGRKTSLTLKNGSSVQVIPCDASQMQSVEAFGKTFTIHKNLVASVKRIDTAWKNSNPKYDIKTIGGYNCRTIANSNKLSYHSYGLSVDINENTNGVNTAGNMPASFRKLWTDEGWGWGGSWSSYKDPMHFSKGANEQGDMRGE